MAEFRSESDLIYQGYSLLIWKKLGWNYKPMMDA